MPTLENWRDELALSVDDPGYHVSSSPIKSPSRASLSRSQKPSSSTSKRKSTRRFLDTDQSVSNSNNVSDLFSPSRASRTFRINTPRVANDHSSPSRIRVTIEASHDQEMPPDQPPSTKKVTTTIVPLKDADAPSRFPRRRGRPPRNAARHGENSQTSIASIDAKQSIERSPQYRPPTPGRPARLPDDMNEDNERGQEIRVDDELTVRRKRGRPRKDVQTQNQVRQSPGWESRSQRTHAQGNDQARNELFGDIGGAHSSPLEAATASRRIASSNRTNELSSGSASASSGSRRDRAKESSPAAAPTAIPTKRRRKDPTPPQNNPSPPEDEVADDDERDIWAPTPQPVRRALPRPRQAQLPLGQVDEIDDLAAAASPIGRNSHSDLSIIPRDAGLGLADHEPDHYPPQTSSPVLDAPLDDVAGQTPAIEEEDHEDEDEELEDSTAALDRSAYESEGFSMVSIDSLRHHKARAEREAARAQEEASLLEEQDRRDESTRPKQQPTPQESSSRNQTQTPPVQRELSQSPPLVHSPLQRQSSKKISPAVRAGSVLQEALSSPMGTRSMSPGATKQHTPPRYQVRDIFKGFGDASQKALRRSIAMGELLAQQEQQQHVDAKNLSVTANGHSTRLPSMAYPRLPTPEDSQESGGHRLSVDAQDRDTARNNSGTRKKRDFDEMSWRPTTISQYVTTRRHADESKGSADAMSWKKSTPPKAVDEARNQFDALAQKRELDYQREREEIIRQSQRASTDARISIDTDNEQIPQKSARMTQIKGKERATSRDADGDEPMADASIRSETALEPQDPTQTHGDVWQEEADRSLEDSMEGARRKRARPEPRAQQSRQVEASTDRGSHSRGEVQVSAEDVSGDTNLGDQEQDLRELLGEDDQPIRGKLPRTWRRADGNSLLYSDESGDTPAKSEQAQRFTFGKAGMYDSIPTVLRRAQRSASVGDKTSPNKPYMADAATHRGILHSPRRGPSPLSSPPKEVRFAEATNDRAFLRAPSRMGFYPPADDSRDETEVDETRLSDSVDQTAIEKSHLDPADLQSPTLTNSPPSSPPISRLNINRRPTNLPGLFDTFPPPVNAPVPAQVPTGKPISANTTSTAESTSNATSAEDNTPGFLKKLTSAISYPFTFLSPVIWPAPTPHTPAADPQWTTNHTLLLTHYSLLSRNKQVPGPRLPANFSSAPLPAEFDYLIGKRYTTTATCKTCGIECPYRKVQGRKWSTNLGERDARVVHLFIDIVKEKGIPLLRGPDGEGKEPVREPRMPGETGKGKVSRRREEWKIETVAYELFCCLADEWVRAELCAVLREEQEESLSLIGRGG